MDATRLLNSPVLMGRARMRCGPVEVAGAVDIAIRQQLTTVLGDADAASAVATVTGRA